ncbi:MAG: alanine--tRNA ligase [Candidatus Nomurabacteria bacterium]|nr:MAG: alanine--tRNA ligase [Candidatus Nomurabacteria bacterium]
MNAQSIRKEFLEYFASKGHAVVPSSSLIPDNDASVLLTTAGMQQFKPYFLGQRDPKEDFGANRLCSVQKCYRTSDIEPVGDASHHTFFEMLGNFAMHDYFKPEAIAFAWEFLTKKMHLHKDRLWATYYAGDELVGEDSEAAKLWEEYLPKERIQGFGRDANWWGPPGNTGSCGPCAELHYDMTEKACALGEQCKPNCACGRFVELWNLVFTEYEKNEKGEFTPLPTKNIDTGMGLERLATVVQKKQSNYETDLFAPIFEFLEKDEHFGQLEFASENLKRMRIVADHIRGAVFLLADGVRFSNKDRGYVLRRVVRRAIDQYASLELTFAGIVETIVSMYEMPYPYLREHQSEIVSLLEKELEGYRRVLKADVTVVYKKVQKQLGSQELEEMTERTPSERDISAEEAFRLFTSYGFSPDRLKKEGYRFDEAAFQEFLKQHQDVSRSQSGKVTGFHGGLADTKPNTVRGHTATHLLQAALREVLGNHVAQKGSNITTERVRFDFLHPDKMTPEQIQQVEQIVNEKIKADLPVYKKWYTVAEAKEIGALGLFEERYGDKVSVYLMGSEDPAKVFSKEFCGGPHVAHTGLIGSFKISKEESSSAGVRRIKALVGESLDPSLAGKEIETL